MKAFVILPMIALAATSVGVTPRKPSLPAFVEPKPVRTVRITESTTFRTRWEAVQGLPPMKDQSRELAEVPVRTESIPVPRVEPDPEPEGRRTPPRRVTRDICQRHGMVKKYTRGGRSWRCAKTR